MWTFEKTAQLFELPLTELLYKAQTTHRENFKPNEVQLCTLLSIKTGTCPEDCAYCPQSAHYETPLKKENLYDVERVVNNAKNAKAQGATRFCMGAAWRSPPKKEFPKVLEMIRAVKNLGLETCVTLGMVDQMQADALHEAGLDYYNHNLDTSPEFYKKIITTRTYEDRLNTLECVRNAGIHVCSGGIIGMGETRDDRIHLLLQLANLPTPPQSVPINRLMRIKGTPLENVDQIDNIEFIRMIAVARIMMPTSFVRLSAGRDTMSDEMHALCFMAGANSIFLGDILLTTPNPEVPDDALLLQKLGLTAKKMNHSFHQHLEQHEENVLTRKRFIIEARDDAYVWTQGKRLINFSSNDYLNLGTHPDVKTAFIKGVEQYGFGSGSSSLISGFYKPHHALEEAFAEFLGVKRAILFNSGYHANLGILTALCDSESIIIADKHCHASLIDGMRLARAKFFRFRHNHFDHAETLLKKYAHYPRILVTESIFSMEGNISDIKSLAALSRLHEALLFVDDAHGIGVLGKHGRGISEYFNLSAKDIPCLSLPLGKAFGSTGALVVGNEILMDVILQFARTYCYTTALPPAVSVATLEALKIVERETWRREKLQGLIQNFIRCALSHDLPLLSYDETPIKCILVDSNKKALCVQQQLFDQGFFVSAIRPPTVPQNEARIKISLNCAHTESQINSLMDALYTCLKIS